MCVAVIRSKQLIWMYDHIAMACFVSNGVNYKHWLYYIMKLDYFSYFCIFPNLVNDDYLSFFSYKSTEDDYKLCGSLDYIDYISGGGDKDISYVSLMFMFFCEFVTLFEFLC